MIPCNRSIYRAVGIKQHLFPKRSIERFCNENGVVQVSRAPNFEPFPAKPQNSIFCANRVWDQKSEDLTKNIEDQYQEVFDSVVLGDVRNLDTKANKIVGHMFSLWRVRSYMKEHPFPDVPLVGVRDALAPINQNKRDELERQHIMSLAQGAILTGRMLAWPFLLREVTKMMLRLEKTSWGIVQSNGREFLVPDRFTTTLVMPISPKMAFVAGNSDMYIPKQEIAKINTYAISEMREYFFARDIEQCPTI